MVFIESYRSITQRTGSRAPTKAQGGMKSASLRTRSELCLGTNLVFCPHVTKKEAEGGGNQGPLQKQERLRTEQVTLLGWRRPAAAAGKFREEIHSPENLPWVSALSQITRARLTSKRETSRGLIVHFILPGACELERAVISDPKIEEVLKGDLLPAEGSETTEEKGRALVSSAWPRQKL